MQARHLLQLISLAGDAEFSLGDPVGHPSDGDTEVPVSLLVAGNAVVAQDNVLQVALRVGYEQSPDGCPISYDLKF